jgi:hypothetical protein
LRDWSYWLFIGSIRSSENLPDILTIHRLVSEVDSFFAHVLSYQLLALVLYAVALGTDFVLVTKLVAVGDEIAGEVLSSCAVFDDQLSVSLDGLAHQCWLFSLQRQQSPYRIEDRLGNQGDFTVAREPGEYLGSYLAWREVEWFVEEVGVGHEAHVLPVSYEFLGQFRLGVLNWENWASARTKILWSSGAGISFLISDDFIVRVEYQEAISLLAHEHDTVAFSQKPVLAESLGHPLESLWVLLLNLTNDEGALVFLVEVVAAGVEVKVDVFGPIADSSLQGVLGAAW